MAILEDAYLAGLHYLLSEIADSNPPKIIQYYWILCIRLQRWRTVVFGNFESALQTKNRLKQWGLRQRIHKNGNATSIATMSVVFYCILCNFTKSFHNFPSFCSVFVHYTKSSSSLLSLEYIFRYLLLLGWVNTNQRVKYDYVLIILKKGHRE